MANPMLPAPFHLGSYLGEQLGSGLQKGLQAGIQDSYESKIMENAFNKLSPESNAFERAKVFMSLPISDEKKKMGMQFLQQQQQQASQQQKQMMDFRKGLRKNLLDFAQQGNEFLPASELSRVEEEASRIFAETGDAYAAYQGAIKKMAEEEAQASDPVAAIAGVAEQNKPEGSPGALGALTRDAFGTYGSPFMNALFEPGDRSPVFKKPDPDKEELFTSGLRTGSLAGTLAGEEMTPKQRENYEKAGFWGQMAFSAGALLGDLPFFYAMGPIGGYVATAVGKTLTKDIRAEIKKEGATTPEDIQRIAMNATQELAKSATEGLILNKIPYLKAVAKKIPGGEKVVNNAVGEGLTTLLEHGTVMSTTRPAFEGRMPTKEDVASGFTMAAGMQAMRIPGSLAQGRAEKPPGTPKGLKGSPEQPKGPEPKKTGSNVPPGSEATGDTSIPTGGPPSGPESPKPGEPLKKSAERTSKVFTEAQPQSGEAAVKAREERASQALEKPIELEPSGFKETETLKAEAKTADELRAKQRELNQEVRSLNELERSRVKVSEAERTAINEKQLPAQEAKVNALKKEVRALQRKLAGKEPVSEQTLADVPRKVFNRIMEEAAGEGELTPKQQLTRQKARMKAQETLKKAEALKGEAKLPDGYTDSYIRTHEAYNDAYNKIIKDLESDLKYLEGDKSAVAAKQRDIANKALEITKNRLAESEAKLKLHKHKKAAEFKAKEVEAKPKREAMKKTAKGVEKAAKRSQKEAKKLIDDYRQGKAKLKEAAEAAGVDPEKAQEAKDDVKEAFEEFKQKTEQKSKEHEKAKEEKKTEEPKKSKFRTIEELKTALNFLKNKEYAKFLNTQLGRALLINIALTAAEEVFGFKVPYLKGALSSWGILKRGVGITSFISFVSSLAHMGIKRAKQSSKINEMAEAMLARDNNKIQRLRAEFKPSELKEARALYEQKYAARKKR